MANITTFRLQPSYSSESQPGVDREKEMLIGVSACSTGEALGHGLWIDDAMLNSLIGYEKLPVRFSHPNMCQDGLGRLIGRATNFRKSDSRVLCDIKLSKSAKKSPQGDLVDYVLTLAEEDPDACGMSIAFERDTNAEVAFMEQHFEGGIFTSPDPENVNSYPHCRCAKLRAVDLVDEPASNPNGLFSQPNFMDAFKFVTGLNEKCNVNQLFGRDIEIIKETFQQCMNELNMQFTEKIMEVETVVEETPAVEEMKAEEVVEVEEVTPELVIESVEVLAATNDMKRIVSIIAECEKFGVKNIAADLIESSTPEVEAFAEIRRIALETLSGALPVEANPEPVNVEKTAFQRAKDLSIAEKISFRDALVRVGKIH